MQTYHYDETTKEYTHSEDAFLDPLESKQQGRSVYLLPANATLIAPTHKDGYATIWNGEAWEHIEDNRGKEYWLTTDEYGTPAQTMKELGPLPDGATTTPPKKPLALIKADKIAELKAARDAAEIEPIEYNENRFDYDEQARDRLAIARQAIEDGAADGIVWTTADNTRVSLALDDFKGIGIAAALRSNALHVKYNELKSWVQAAETAEDVAAVVW